MRKSEGQERREKPFRIKASLAGCDGTGSGRGDVYLAVYLLWTVICMESDHEEYGLLQNRGSSTRITYRPFLKDH